MLFKIFENDDSYSVFRELWNVVQDKLVGVSQHIKLLLLMVWNDTTDYLSLCVFELSVSSVLLSFLLVGELICHFE